MQRLGRVILSGAKNHSVIAGDRTAEKLGEMLPAGVGKVWTAGTSRFKGKAAAEVATAELVARL